MGTADRPVVSDPSNLPTESGAESREAACIPALFAIFIPDASSDDAVNSSGRLGDEWPAQPLAGRLTPTLHLPACARQDATTPAIPTTSPRPGPRLSGRPSRQAATGSA